MKSFADIRAAAPFLIVEVLLRLVPGLVYIYVARQIGARDFGQLMFALAVLVFASISVTPWLDVIGLRDSARAESTETVHAITVEVLIVKLVLAVVVYLAIVFSVYAFGFFPDGHTLLVIGGISLLATACNTNWVMQARSAPGALVVGALFQSGVFIASALAMLASGLSSLGIVIAKTLGDISGATVVGLNYVKRLGKPDKVNFSPSDARNRILISLPILFTQVAVTSYNYADRLILGKLAGYHELGIYVAASTILGAVTIPAVVWWNTSAAQIAVNRGDTRQELVKRLYIKCMLTGVAIAASVAISADAIVQILYGPQYVDAALVLRILMVGLIANYAAVALGTPLMVLGRQRAFALIAVCGAVTNAILNVALAGSLGAVGAAIAATIGFAVVAGASGLVLRDTLHN